MRIIPTAQAKYILQTTLAHPDQSLQQELVFFQRFSGSNIFTANKNPFPSVKLNAYAPASPEKSIVVTLMKHHTEAAFITLG